MADSNRKAMEDFRKQQYAFAAHLRNPDEYPAPEGIEDRRMKIYRDLFINNMKNLLASTFPVLHSIFGDDEWALLVREFYHHHESHTPLFQEIPREFLHWMQNEMAAPERWPRFMLELAHYEWVELALMVSSDSIDEMDVVADGNILDGIPVLSPVAWPLAYRFPVHRIGRDFQPDSPGKQPTFLVVYRKRDDSVGFSELNAVTARLLDLMQEKNDRTGRELLQQVAEEMNHPDPEVVINGGKDIFDGLIENDIVLGTRR